MEKVESIGCFFTPLEFQLCIQELSRVLSFMGFKEIFNDVSKKSVLQISLRTYQGKCKEFQRFVLKSFKVISKKF